ncbi:MAG: hypothetical protein H7X99_06335 [Saprospiraceae bacterium]|nr:hypothetical protein [Saprospiraceae bacterium]
MKSFYNLFCFTAIVICVSCAKVYYSPEAEAASANHKIIAVAPPKVTIPAQKNVSSDELSKMSVKESESFQYEIVSWLLKRKSQNKINVDILDATTTQAKLHNSDVAGKMMTPNEMTSLLDVDAILTSNFKLSKPMSTGAAIATTVLFGFGTTNEVIVTMELHDRNTNKMIWNFSHSVSGGLFSSSDQLVDEVMRIASKKLPYTKFKK